jgi:PAS domain S-box-containing protein
MDEAPVGITVADATLPDEPLVYVNDAFERLTGYPAEEVLGRNCRFLQGPDTDPDAVRELRAGIESAEAVSVELRNYRRDGEPFWNRVELAPIRDESGTVTHYIGFQTDVTRRRRAAKAARRWAEECRAERRTVEHVLDRVEGLVEEVTQVLVGASSRREVERGVCDRVAATDGYAAAWVGGRDRSRGAVTTRAWTGDASLPLANLSVDLSADAPTARAVSSGDVQLAVDSDAPFPDVEGSSGSSVESMIAVPLTYRETTYGVLNVYATEADAFDDHDAAVLASIGRATGNAINAIESKRMVAADGVVDLEVTVADPDAALAGLADDAGCRLTFEGANRRTDGSVSVFLRADGSVPTDLPSLADSYPSIADATVLDGESEWSLAEITLSPDSVLGRIVDMGVRVTGLDATGEGVSFGFEASGEPVTRSTVDLLEDRFAAVDLTGLRRRERGDRSGHGFARRIRKRLTDRQLTALQKAYFGGFFERPHGVTGGELADSMGITRSTFHQHLLAAQRKLLDGFFEERTERGSVPH